MITFGPNIPERVIANKFIYAAEEVAIDATFVDELIKLSEDADQIFIDCGRIRLQRAIQAAVQLHKQMSARRTQEASK